jgi:cation diffusion facilitator family transporter
VGLNLLAAVYQKRRGGELRSRLLLAGAARLPFDLFVSVLVLASLVAASLGWARLDALAALLIVGEIGYTGWQMARCACQVLADRAVVDPAVVEAVALSVTGVRSCHKIRSRGPAWASHLDLHLQIDGCLPLEEAHRLGHLTRRRLEKRLKVKDVIVHLEPADSLE